ncbi:MAG TPA: DEAD/DEAH box helicase [bacterium]|nr:DEAD/DEAH box helicase [bacterium]
MAASSEKFMQCFEELKLNEELLRAVKTHGYEKPTPIQQKAIPLVLEGHDLLGCAQTGTGKTAAFALPILQRLSKKGQTRKARPHVRVLILTPTRELASQIGESFAAYGRHTGLRHAVIFGGVKQGPQTDALRRGVDILVATPGRLIDLTEQGFIRYNSIEMFVLDEADRMLDMGFIHDVRRIITYLPQKRQTLLFSATLPAEINALANSILTDPLSVAVDPPASTVDLIKQNLYFVEKPDKAKLLVHLMKDSGMNRVLIFTRTKYGADKLCKKLRQSKIRADSIHGNKSQHARTCALADFKAGRTRVLVATDIASRGIDVDNVSHVINFDLPNEPESYVHRIGRTGRAGTEGVAISFCDEAERKYLPPIERLMHKLIPVVQDDYPYRTSCKPPMPTDLEQRNRCTRVQKKGFRNQQSSGYRKSGYFRKKRA